MRGLLRILLNVVTAVSLVLCVAAVVLWAVGRRPVVIGRSWVTPGIDAEAPGGPGAGAGGWASPVTGGPRRFHESVSAVVVAHGSLTVVGQVISYAGPARPAPGHDQGYDDRERRALARGDGRWRARGYEDLLSTPVPGTWPYEVRTRSSGAAAAPPPRRARFLPYRARDDAGYFHMGGDEQWEHRWFPTFAGLPKTWRVWQRTFGLAFYAVAFSVLPLARCGAVARRLVHRYRQRHVGLCRACGYDLRATPERCPECGNVSTS